MADALNAAYFNRTGVVEIAEDNFTRGVASFALVPTTPTAKHVDIGGGVQAVTGAPEWQAQITFSQDWVNALGWSRKSIEWAGTEKTIKYTPQTGADPVEVTVVFQPSQVGGAAAGIPTATLNLDVVGQPNWDPEA
jgi:hypothetical protein